jgi:hypothetical protein
VEAMEAEIRAFAARLDDSRFHGRPGALTDDQRSIAAWRAGQTGETPEEAGLYLQGVYARRDAMPRRK